MKSLILIAITLFFPTYAIAGDDWSERNNKAGETIYKSGYEQVLLVGARGVGFMYSLPSAVDLMGEEVVLRIDDGSQEKFKTVKIVANTILISPSPEVVKRIANAKRVELSYRMCPANIDGCTFSYFGGTTKSKWEFETTLAEQFKGYQEKIR
jgi:hypothetical protein